MGRILCSDSVWREHEHRGRRLEFSGRRLESGIVNEYLDGTGPSADAFYIDTDGATAGADRTSSCAEVNTQDETA